MSSYLVHPPRQPVISVGTKGAIPRFEINHQGASINKALELQNKYQQNAIHIDTMIHMAQPRFNKMTGTQNYIGEKSIFDAPTRPYKGQKGRTNMRGASINLSSAPKYFPQGSPLMPLAGANPTSKNPLGVVY